MPIILMLAITVVMEFLAAATETLWIKGIVGVTSGICGMLVILAAVGWIAKRLQIPTPRIVGWRDLAIGLVVGLLISITCGLLFREMHGEPTTVTFGMVINPISFLRNMGPALIEEASMRAGVVHLLNGLSGPWAGLAGGSLPFGLLHIFGRIFGNPVGVAHVIGTTASGLLLSILYLRFGFWAAFGCHWIWNSLAGAWVIYAGITAQDGMQQFEGAPETVIILAIACACLFAVGDRHWLRPRSEKEKALRDSP